jgi:translation elongation factor aEF-1 beta
MGTAGIKIKLMPESPDINLEEVETKAKAIVESKGGKNRDYITEEVAFGLKSLTVFFELSEEIEPSVIEESLKTIEGVGSTQITDMRRLM